MKKMLKTFSFKTRFTVGKCHRTKVIAGSGAHIPDSSHSSSAVSISRAQSDRISGDLLFSRPLNRGKHSSLALKGPPPRLVFSLWILST